MNLILIDDDFRVDLPSLIISRPKTEDLISLSLDASDVRTTDLLSTPPSEVVVNKFKTISEPYGDYVGWIKNQNLLFPVDEFDQQRKEQLIIKTPLGEMRQMAFILNDEEAGKDDFSLMASLHKVYVPYIGSLRLFDIYRRRQINVKNYYEKCYLSYGLHHFTNH